MFDPGTHDLSGQPVPTDFGFDNDGHSVPEPQGISAPCQQEGGHIRVQRLTGLQMAVMLDVDGMPKKGPAVTLIVFDVVPGIQ
ncbi:hypothetical protein ACFVGM_32800 [Kitasatospora purpeofusca]|uniref:hypothetical protein n=1 Tax=Kitasatospora purpeofusca TaxID=67352 RepID=UPI0036989910